MTDNERDTHFQNAAKLLYYKLAALKGSMPPHLNDDDWIRAEQTLIAQFAYDLARHIVWEAMGGTPNAITIIVADVPDLTEWPILHDPTQQSMWREETILATDLSECPEPE